MLARFLALPEADHGHRAARAWLDERLTGEDRPLTPADDSAFGQYVCDRYYRICRDAIKAADPNHLYLGSRLIRNTAVYPPALRAMAPYVDVLSVNWYNAWTPDDEWLDVWLSETGRPFVITEWYANGDDSGMGNRSGAGWLVRTQADRGAFYQNYTLALLEHPACVGWHWFKYIDNDPAANSDPSNRDGNKGVVTNRYEPYPALLKRMAQVNRHVYALRDELCPPEKQPAKE